MKIKKKLAGAAEAMLMGAARAIIVVVIVPLVLLLAVTSPETLARALFEKKCGTPPPGP